MPGTGNLGTPFRRIFEIATDEELTVMEFDDKGYDKEEEYFHRQNKELIERRRAELDAKRAEQKARELQARHWMRCPKCGHEMEEVEMSGLKVDRCTSCDGLFFDAGELEILLEAREPKGFLSGLRRVFD